MSRSISATARNAVFSSGTAEEFAVLLELDHDDLAEPIRVCSHAKNITHNGNEYVAYAFDILLPDDVDDRPPTARVEICNVSRMLIEAVRSISSAINVNIKIVLVDSPDTVEAEFVDFKLVNITYDAMRVRGDLTIEDFTSEPYPAATFSPTRFPGMF